jgi:hypothetical protein
MICRVLWFDMLGFVVLAAFALGVSVEQQLIIPDLSLPPDDNSLRLGLHFCLPS